ncbi:MAG: hypothetical protein EXS69_00230 [Candidatus Zambryskibacteria bacterium]|nr:hypothetical protein [Candidatus Zambryskibacteria bacterium]
MTELYRYAILITEFLFVWIGRSERNKGVRFLRQSGSPFITRRSRMTSNDNVMLRTAQDVEDQAQNLSREAIRLREMADGMISQATRLRQYAEDLRRQHSRLRRD